MRVAPPSVSRATGELDRLLVELGYPVPGELDEEVESFAERHDELFEEISAFARRGWASWFDAESDMSYDARLYVEVLDKILKPLGIREINFDDERGIVTLDARAIQVPKPEQDDDWLDVAWLFEVAQRVVVDTEWQLLEVADDGDLHCVIAAVVPRAVWDRVRERRLAGSWRAIGVTQPLFN